MPAVSANSANRGLTSVVPFSRKPAAFISSSTKLSAPLLKTTIFTGAFNCCRESKSPSNMASPPSPERVTTWRSGNANCAPMACGMALAIEPWLNEPSRRRFPFIFKYRAAQIVGVPTSQEKIAFSDATSSDQPGHILGMNRFLAGNPYGEVVQTLPDVFIMSDEFLEMSVIGLGLDFSQQRIESFLHIADQTQIEAGAPSQMLSPAIHLNDGSLFRIKLCVGKIGAEQKQRIAFHHGMKAGGIADQPGQPDVIRTIVLDVFPAPQSRDDGRLQFLRHLHQFRMGAGTPSPAQNRHGLRFIQQRGECRNFAFRRPKQRFDTLDTGAGLAIMSLFERDVSRNCHDRNALFGERGLYRDFQNPRHLSWLGNKFAVVTAIFEQLVGVRLLKIRASDFAAGDVRGNGQHRHAAAMTIVETIDKVHVSRAATSGADRQFAC